MKKAKKKLEYMAIYIVTTFLACYTVYYISQLITNRMKEADKVWGSFISLKFNHRIKRQYNILHVLQFSTLYLAPAIYPVIFGFMLKDVRRYIRSIKDRLCPSIAPKKLEEERGYSPSTMHTRFVSMLYELS